MNTGFKSQISPMEFVTKSTEDEINVVDETIIESSVFQLLEMIFDGDFWSRDETC